MNEYHYYMNDIALERTTEEKISGVYVTPDLKSSAHVSKVAAKANSAVGQIKKAFTYMDKEMFLALYLTLVRPLMEYAVQAWPPKLIQDINKLEKVQRRATKLVPEIRDLPYETRLRILGLPLLSERRIRGDMIEGFKILNGFENIDSKKFFKRATEPDLEEPSEGVTTRGHSHKLEKSRYDHFSRMKFFDARVINKWNSLPETVVSSNNINSFKRNYDSFIRDLKSRGILNEFLTL